jgi:hypothetical protein
VRSPCPSRGLENGAEVSSHLTVFGTLSFNSLIIVFRPMVNVT